MKPNTHPSIDPAWVGRPVELEPGVAVAELTTTAGMAADARGLVHGGFVFGLADYAAMLAVNDPNVVLGAAETKFSRPVVVGDVVRARATVETASGKKRAVKVTVTRGEDVVLEGSFTCFVLERHVLDGR